MDFSGVYGFTGMDAILIELLSKYAEGGLITICLAFLVLLNRKISKLDEDNKQAIKDLEHSLQDRFTKEETKTLVQQEIRVIEQTLSNMNNSIERIDRSMDRTNDTLSEVRTCLLNLNRRKD